MCVRVLNLCIPSVQDITPRETVRQAPKCDRDVTLYGFLRGTNMKPGARVHVAGVGDYTIQVCLGDGGTSGCEERGIDQRAYNIQARWMAHTMILTVCSTQLALAVKS